MIFDSEMRKALEADGEKLRQLTGTDHGPYFINEENIMKRISRDDLGLRLAKTWALRSTCTRRAVGCVLVDVDGWPVGQGYNGPASKQPHCIDKPCRGAGLAPGTGLEACEAIHAEANALLRCSDVRAIHTAYVTHSPCLHCVKLLMNTGCKRIVFLERYAHDEDAQRLWIASGQRATPERSWEQGEVMG